jgi:hypothetical protein
VEEPVLAGFWLAPTGACDESDDPRAGTGVIDLPPVASLFTADSTLGIRALLRMATRAFRWVTLRV